MEKLTTGSQKHSVRSWYGLPAEIAVENRLWHFVKVWGIPLPHPPVVNLILRRGLPEQDRLYLNYLHELGHLQTFPIMLPYAVFLLLAKHRCSERKPNLLTQISQLLLALQAVWEMAAESFVLFHTGSNYHHIYDHKNRTGRSFFWVSMIALATYFTQRSIQT